MAIAETDQTRASTALRDHGYRVTPQRVAIYEAVRELDRHVSADEVLRAVAPRLPNVSLPTVYATLDALEDAGLVRRVAAGRGRALYDARAAEHHHLVCRRCGAVEDLEGDTDLAPLLTRAGERGFAAETAEVVVHGLCSRCR